eukprot:9083648-Pyramimonas_sp.AAC.2
MLRRRYSNKGSLEHDPFPTLESVPPCHPEPSSGSALTPPICVRRAQASGLGCRDWFTPRVYTSSPDVIGSRLSVLGVLRPTAPSAARE